MRRLLGGWWEVWGVSVPRHTEEQHVGEHSLVPERSPGKLQSAGNENETREENCVSHGGLRVSGTWPAARAQPKHAGPTGVARPRHKSPGGVV